MTKEQKVIYDRQRYLANQDAAKARAKRWRLQHPDRVKVIARKSKAAHKPAIQEYGRQRYLARKEQQTNYTRLKKYRMTPEEYDKRLEEQKGLCALCPRSFVECAPRGPRIDHCHATDKVRSLLCHQCNTGLGMFRDSPELLRKAADYFERHR